MLSRISYGGPSNLELILEITNEPIYRFVGEHENVVCVVGGLSHVQGEYRYNRSNHEPKNTPVKNFTLFLGIIHCDRRAERVQPWRWHNTCNRNSNGGSCTHRGPGDFDSDSLPAFSDTHALSRRS